MINKKQLLAASIGLFMVVGCASIPEGNLSEYPNDVSSSMARVDRMPSEAELNGEGRVKVVVLNSAAEENRYPNSTQQLTKELEALLAGNGVEIVDRSLARKLDDEIKMCEMAGKKCGTSTGPAFAKYAIKATITSASYGSEFVATQYIQTKKGTITIPAHYAHKANASVTVKIYELPSLREVTAIVADDSASDSTDRREDLGVAMVAKALKSAIGTGDAKANLLNPFAPKGYVVGRRDGKDGSMFRVSIGTKHGLVPGAPVTLFTEQEVTDPITQKTSYELVDLGRATTSKNIKETYAWVVPDDKTVIPKIHLGDIAQVQHKAGNRGLEQLKGSLSGLLGK